MFPIASYIFTFIRPGNFFNISIISSTVVGFSGGSVYTDANCERIKLAKTLNDLGLKVSAVAVLCGDNRVWDAMMMSGSPCPIDGLVGDAARNQWIKTEPKKFEKLYGYVPEKSKPNNPSTANKE